MKKLVSGLLIIVLSFSVLGCSKKEEITMSNYESYSYNQEIDSLDLFAADLSVTNSDVNTTSFFPTASTAATGLFDITNGTVLYADSIFDPVFPANTTKIMTAYVVLKYGNLEDIVTITEEDLNLPSDSSVCGFEVGDSVSLYDLLVGLLIHPGNDSALAIARHISGDIDSFVALMNSEAISLGATGSHFANPHGLHDENHYTTVYDLYLIFNECIKNQKFYDIISMSTYDTMVVSENGTEKPFTWVPTNSYSTGDVQSPENVTIIGGKTGYTSNAGSCLVLLSESSDKTKYISIVMDAELKSTLYKDMTAMIESLEN